MKKIPEKRKAKIIKIKKSALKNMDERGFGAILEDLSEKFSIMIEGLSMVNQKVDTFKDEITETIKSNFNTVFGYLSHIDEEIQQIKLELENFKASKAEGFEVAKMKIRIANLEYELAEVRRIAERRT